LLRPPGFFAVVVSWARIGAANAAAAIAAKIIV
jgi:hypothetical protein